MGYTFTLTKKHHILWLVKNEQVGDIHITGYKDGDKSAYTMRCGNSINVFESEAEVIEKIKDYPEEKREAIGRFVAEIERLNRRKYIDIEYVAYSDFPAYEKIFWSCGEDGLFRALLQDGLPPEIYNKKEQVEYPLAWTMDCSETRVIVEKEHIGKRYLMVYDMRYSYAGLSLIIEG